MGILTIAPATRGGMKLLISLYGLSETGKTLSALKLACGIEPDPAKRMLLDTEGGERGRAYVDHVPGGYMYASLTPPFTPQRYTDAINEIEAAGINVLVIDSGSHVWFAEGGVLDMADASEAKNGLGKWIEPKKRLRRMTNRMLSSDMHIIICSRAKQVMIEEIVDGKKKMALGPIQPVQEKNLRYDMTIMALMLGDGRFTIAQNEGGKCPGALRPIFAASERMDEAMGQKLAAWVAGADIKTPEQRKLELDATAAAEGGSAAFREFWAPLSRESRALIAQRLDNYKSIASAADREAEEEAKRRRDAATDLDDPFGSLADRHDPDTGEVIEQASAAAQPTNETPAADPEPDDTRVAFDQLVAELEACKTVKAQDAFLADNRARVHELTANRPDIAREWMALLDERNKTALANKNARAAEQSGMPV